MVQEVSESTAPVQEQEQEDKAPLTPQKPKMLMKDGEKSENKSSVKFDESQNVVKEFHKGQKIMNFDKS